jgi:hypothetical protein
MSRHRIGSFDELLRRALDPDWFWNAVVEDLQLEWCDLYHEVVDLTNGEAWATWFSDGKFNRVHNPLDRHVTTDARDQVALVWEIEAAAVAHPAVISAAEIGVPHAIKGEAIAVFVVEIDPDLETANTRADIFDLIASSLGKALRPDQVLFARDLPRTRNAKLLRRIIRARHLGHENLGDLSVLENPASLDAIATTR